MFCILAQSPTVMSGFLDELSADLRMVGVAAFIYVVGLLVIRIGRNRLLGRTTAFDIVLAFILGSLFSRVINGGAAVGASIVAALALVLLHWGFGAIARRSTRLDNLVKGHERLLIEDGRVRHDQLRIAELSERDLIEAVRLRAGIEDLSRIHRAYLERNGQISVIQHDGGASGGAG